MPFRITLIAAAIVAMAAPANAQQSSPERGIRIITPYSEHI
jgi:tripartite-type tricarboxylate transporter receptor subunit TctC